MLKFNFLQTPSARFFLVFFVTVSSLEGSLNSSSASDRKWNEPINEHTRPRGIPFSFNDLSTKIYEYEGENFPLLDYQKTAFWESWKFPIPFGPIRFKDSFFSRLDLDAQLDKNLGCSLLTDSQVKVIKIFYEVRLNSIHGGTYPFPFEELVKKVNTHKSEGFPMRSHQFETLWEGWRDACGRSPTDFRASFLSSLNASIGKQKNGENAILIGQVCVIEKEFDNLLLICGGVQTQVNTTETGGQASSSTMQ